MDDEKLTPSEAEQNAAKEEYEALLQQSLKNKKRFIQILTAIGLAIVLLFVIVVAVDLITRSIKTNDEELFFYSPYEGNIMEYQPYLAKDRKIYYFDGRVILSIEEDNLLSFDYGVLFLCDFIDAMIQGDAAAYNGYFEVDPKQAPFSPQMIYDTLISYAGTSVADNGDQLVSYKLEYRIHRNDGTLRRDVGSDRIKPQFITLRITPSGFISVERLAAEQ